MPRQKQQNFLPELDKQLDALRHHLPFVPDRAGSMHDLRRRDVFLAYARHWDIVPELLAIRLSLDHMRARDRLESIHRRAKLWELRQTAGRQFLIELELDATGEHLALPWGNGLVCVDAYVREKLSVYAPPRNRDYCFMEHDPRWAPRVSAAPAPRYFPSGDFSLDLPEDPPPDI